MAKGRSVHLGHPTSEPAAALPLPDNSSWSRKAIQPAAGCTTSQRLPGRLKRRPSPQCPGRGLPGSVGERLRSALGGPQQARGSPAPPALTFSTPSSCLGLMSTPSIRSGADCAPLSAAFISSAVIAAPCAVYSGSWALGARQALSAAGLSALGRGRRGHRPANWSKARAPLPPGALAARSGVWLRGGRRWVLSGPGSDWSHPAAEGGAGRSGSGSGGRRGWGGEVSRDRGGRSGSGSSGRVLV